MMELRYIRDTDKHEVDFVVIQDKNLLFAVEFKNSDINIQPSLRYVAQRTPIAQFFQVHLGRTNREKDGVRVLPFVIYGKCSELKDPSSGFSRNNLRKIASRAGVLSLARQSRTIAHELGVLKADNLVAPN